MARNRYSPQKKQEQISRKQFETYLEQHEWITGDIEPDLGEDILVRIFRDGVSTGLSLYVQLKSVKAIADHQLLTGEISHDFDVDDLGHWEVQTPTVFIIIWDVTQSTGWWINITDAILYLDKHNPNWRKNNTAAVRIPVCNRVDEDGLNRIRNILANLYGPVIAKNKELTINAKFLFPSTPEGRKKFEAYKRTMTAGDEIELEGQYIQDFVLPEWWTRIYGVPDPKEMVVWIGSTPSHEILPMQIEFHSNEIGQVQIPYVEFQRVKQGSEETTLSNDQQNIPIKFSMVVFPKTATCTFTVNTNFLGLDGQVALRLINIEKIFAEGGTISITDLKSDVKWQIPIPPGTSSLPDSQFTQFVENLATIQKITGKALKIPDFHSLTFSQMKETQELASIVTTGHFTRTVNHIEIELLRAGLTVINDGFPQNAILDLRIGYEDTFYDLFSEQFVLGPCVTTVHGKMANSYDEISTWYKQADGGESFKVKLIAPEITDEYRDWLSLNNK
jgi:hypothetical protein